MPVQAVLLTSQPGPDFRGGQFYFTRRSTNDDEIDNAPIHIHRHVVEWENAGDLILFMAGKETGWWHGVMPVVDGTVSKSNDKDNTVEDPRFVRQAIGMLQPL
ncbi:hypothetical protein ACA910_012147 [Epithemia clementina (nom. ined.)]